jgi:hypothetical protein
MINPRAPRNSLLLGLVAASLSLSACHRRPASIEDCHAVLERLVDLELSESGYRDPVLRTRWQQDLGRRFAPDLERCRGLTVRHDLRACLASARTPEEVTHRCLE